MSPDDQHDLDPAIADAVRRAYVQPVDEITAQRHVSAIVATAAQPGGASVPARRSRRRVWQTVAATVTAVVVVPVGMAAAGVTLPDAVERPYRAIGIVLPHQERSGRSAPRAPSANPTTRTTTAASPGAPQPKAPRGQGSSSTRPGAAPTPRSGSGRSAKPTNTPGPNRAPRTAKPAAKAKAKAKAKGKAGASLGRGYLAPLTPRGRAVGRPSGATSGPKRSTRSLEQVTPALPPTMSVPSAAATAPGHNK